MSIGGCVLSSVLREEIPEVEKFIGVLRDEQTLLTEGRIDRLADLSDTKTVLIDRLSALAEERNRLLAEQEFEPDINGLSAWSSRSGPEGEQLRDKLISLAREARELNQINGRLISMRLAHTQGALRALTSSDNGLYDRGGQTAARTGYRLIDSA